MTTGDGGSMAVAMSGVVAIVAVLGVAVASIGVLYAGRAQAANAADAAALAAAVATYPAATGGSDPVATARDVAQRNGAVLLACQCSRDPSLNRRTVEVATGLRVDVPVFGVVTIRSVSRAEFDPMIWLGR